MATVSIPILGGLAHQLNSVETMVMIYSAGNGLVNLFTPTSGAIMGGLALAKVEYSTCSSSAPSCSWSSAWSAS